MRIIHILKQLRCVLFRFFNKITKKKNYSQKYITLQKLVNVEKQKSCQFDNHAKHFPPTFIIYDPQVLINSQSSNRQSVNINN
jgi:hypothetical protein